MAAKDLGTKFLCFKCGTKFYDMRRPDPVCPKCGADQREMPVVRPEKHERRRAVRAAVEEPEIVQEEGEEEELATDEDFSAGGDDDEDY